MHHFRGRDFRLRCCLSADRYFLDLGPGLGWLRDGRARDRQSDEECGRGEKTRLNATSIVTLVRHGFRPAGSAHDSLVNQEYPVAVAKTQTARPRLVCVVNLK